MTRFRGRDGGVRGVLSSLGGFLCRLGCMFFWLANSRESVGSLVSNILEFGLL